MTHVDIPRNDGLPDGRSTLEMLRLYHRHGYGSGFPQRRPSVRTSFGNAGVEEAGHVFPHRPTAAAGRAPACF
jgi:hypothetical protein